MFKPNEKHTRNQWTRRNDKRYKSLTGYENMSDAPVNWKNDKSSSVTVYICVCCVCVWGCVYVYVMNIYVYICRMHVRRKRLAEHAHRRIPTSRISSGRDFLSGNKFPAKDRLSKQIRTSLPPLFADATSSPTCVPYNVTLVP